MSETYSFEVTFIFSVFCLCNYLSCFVVTVVVLCYFYCFVLFDCFVVILLFCVIYIVLCCLIVLCYFVVL